MRPARLVRLVAIASASALVLWAAAPPPVLAAVGSDPGLSQQWGLRQIGAPTAWSTSIGSGVPIAIVDTGIDLAHEDLRDQVAAAVTCVDTGGDPGKCKADGADIAGHGSHVAGIAAAASNNAGIAGVAPGARLIAVRVFQPTDDPVNGPSFGANTDDINAGIRWAIRNVAGKGAINLSIGDDFPIALGTSGFADGIEEAWAAGWVPVVAAGNESNILGLNGEEYGNLNALVVGATGPGGEVADYSSPFGSAKWGLVAPGGNAHASGSKGACQSEPGSCVLSTYKGGEYALLQGTSMATPHVAGAAALLMSAGLGNAAVVQRLLATTDKSKDCGSGCKGRLDVANAVAGLAPAGGGGGGAVTTAPPSGTAAPSPTTAAPGGSSSSPRRTPTPTAAPPATVAGAVASPAAEATTESPPTEPATTALAPAPPDGDGVVGLSVASAAKAVDRSKDDGPPVVATVLAALALIGAGGTAVLAWRRRWGAAA